MNMKSLIGSTQTLFYKFFSEATSELSDLTDEALIVYDSNREIILETAPIRTGVGEYYYKLIIPNNPPHIYVECSGIVDGVKQCTRDIIECIWAENDINTLPATDIIVGTNSYATLEEADTYFTGSIDSNKWFDLGHTVRSKMLISATRRINNLIFKGKKYNSTQALAFPRNYHTDIPLEVKEATFEEALQEIEDFNSPDQRIKLQRLGVTRVSFGDASESYNGSGASKKLHSSLALSLLRPHIVSIVRIER